MYQDVLLHIDGKWTAGSSGRSMAIVNPATEDTLATVSQVDCAVMTNVAVRDDCRCRRSWG